MAVAVVVMGNIATKLAVLTFKTRLRTGKAIGGAIRAGGDAGVVERTTGGDDEVIGGVVSQAGNGVADIGIARTAAAVIGSRRVRVNTAAIACVHAVIGSARDGRPAQDDLFITCRGHQVVGAGRVKLACTVQLAVIASVV